MERKHFIQNTLWAFTAWSLLSKCKSESHYKEVIQKIEADKVNATAHDEGFWKEVQTLFTKPKDFINLNNGAVSSYANVVSDALQTHTLNINTMPSYYLLGALNNDKEQVRNAMAQWLHCDTEEIAFNRNTTEALNTIIFGLPLEPGDEIILCKYDYQHMINAWKQRAARDGVVLKYIDIDVPEDDEKVWIDKYINAISPQTKVLHLTMVMNWTGQVLPVQKIIAAAKKYRCKIIVDAAHALGQMPINISELQCDYLAAPAHKWLGGPTGVGIMYIQKDNISTTYPLLSSFDVLQNNIRKFETLGIHNMAPVLAVADAFQLHETIGAALIQKRLVYLRNYWLNKALLNNNISTYSSLNNEYSNAIATIAIEGKSGMDIEQLLMQQYKIHVSPVMHEKVNGIRITPHIYTTLEELDLLVDALNKIA